MAWSIFYADAPSTFDQCFFAKIHLSHLIYYTVLRRDTHQDAVERFQVDRLGQ